MLQHGGLGAGADVLRWRTLSNVRLSEVVRRLHSPAGSNATSAPHRPVRSRPVDPAKARDSTSSNNAAATNRNTTRREESERRFKQPRVARRIDVAALTAIKRKSPVRSNRFPELKTSANSSQRLTLRGSDNLNDVISSKKDDDADTGTAWSGDQGRWYNDLVGEVMSFSNVSIVATQAV